MNLGTLALACLWLALGQAPEPFYSNQRGYRIPAVINDPARRAEIKHVLLFASSDQGRSWQMVSTITPEKDSFAFYPPGDGSYRLKVATLNQKNVQEPLDPGSEPPDQIIVVDTARPIIHALEARRQGDEISVQWRVQEEFPEWKSWRLEYQVQGAAAWTGIQSQPALSGNAAFRPDTPQTIVVRLSLRDRADNESYAMATVPGNGTYAGTQLTGNTVPGPAPTPALPTAIVVPQQTLPPAPPPVTPAPVAPTPVAPPVARPLPTPPPAAVPAPAPEKAVVADTQWDARARNGVASGLAATAGSAPANPPQVSTRRLPDIQYVNQQKVTLWFEVSKLGPSGVGSLQLWCTKNDGQSWELYAEDRNPGEIGANGRQQLIVPLEEDGVYGFTLVVKNRAGLGKAPPRPGDVPEMRIELDTTPPVARLMAPEPDRDRPDAALLSWVAQDKNQGDRPISLEWSERRGGPWHPIAMDLPNDGRYSWQPPKEIPVQVYLRLRVRDAAGNEALAETREPQLIDLSEPEVRLISVVQPRRP